MRHIAFALVIAAGCSTGVNHATGDMAAADLAAPPAGDMAAPPADLAAPPDLAAPLPPDDMAPPPPDLTPGCGSAVGQQCCTHPLMLPDCQHRDFHDDAIIGCDRDAGVCVKCGGLNLPCCPGNVCYGSQCASYGQCT